MFHPVGSQPPSVYWRRRLLLIGSAVLVVVLLVVTIRAVTSGGGSGKQAAASTPSGTPTSSSRVAPPSTRPVTTTAPRSSTAKASPSNSSGSRSASTSAAPAACRSSDLAVAAVVAKPTYQVGDTPMLELQVTNTGTAPCVQDLADKQVVLKVYNGESRVWGSHDCEVQPGTQLRTLAVDHSVRVTITWSGLTSQPNNCKSRQRVGAGTYTLYATLSGKTGKATQFTMT